MDKYESERYIPKTPSCKKSQINILFDGKFLYLYKPDDSVLKYVAVSGKPYNGKFDYTPTRQKQSFQGPIPEGEYWITLSELWENAWYKQGSTIAWGDFRISIHPYPSTVTHGRGGFFIHGGSVLGSAGCIDLASSMNKFINDIKKIVLSSAECYIPVSVRY